MVHNDWIITGPQISKFDNRLEILSHGGLPSGLPKEQFFEEISKPRNAALMRIVKKYEEVFEIEENYIRCTISLLMNWHSFISLQNKKVIERIGSKSDGSWIVIQ